MKLSRKVKAWLVEHKPAKVKRRRRPRDFHFDAESGNIYWREHGSFGKVIPE